MTFEVNIPLVCYLLFIFLRDRWQHSDVEVDRTKPQ